MKLKTITALALLALACVGLAACGDSDSDENEVSGKLAPVAGAPAAYADVAGEATLTRTDSGTEVSLTATGLEPDTAYVSHLHEGGCDQPDPGGPHFKFDADGGDEPPNEVHLAFTSGADGEGEASASSEREVPAGEAGSVVIHVDEEAGETQDGAMSDEGGSHGDAMHDESSHDGEEHGDGAMHDEAGHEDGAMHDDSAHGGHSHADKVACADLEAPASSGKGAREGYGGSGSGSDSEAEAGGDDAAVPTIVVRDGEPVGGVRELSFDAGERVRFRVRSDVADEVHVHGYDISEDVKAGGSVGFSFAADIEGIFEVELEQRAEQIAELRVEP